MSLLSNAMAIPPASTGYTLTNSLRFRRAASAYLSRTNNKTPTDNTKCSFSIWAKRGDLGSERNYIMATGSGTSNDTNATFMLINDYFSCGQYTVSPYINNNILYRDSSAWYHIFISIDTSLGTASDRFKLYINGTLMSNTGTTASGSTWAFLNNSAVVYIGQWAGYYSDYYLADFQAVDGQALDPTDFGEYDTNTGAWKAKEYTGTYGNAGFRLDMSTSGSTVLDVSGNGNNWTANNMNLTTSSATTYDIMSDVPTLTDENTGNLCTISPIDYRANVVAPQLSNGNLTFKQTSTVASSIGCATFGVSSGKWYWEATYNVSGGGGSFIGWVRDQISNQTPNDLGYVSNEYAYVSTSGNKYNAASSQAYGATYTNGDVIGCALDLDAGTMTFYKNGVSQGTAYSSLPSGYYKPAFDTYNSNSFDANFGQRPFAYTPPTGYKKLNTYNLPDSAIKDGSQYFNTVLDTGANIKTTSEAEYTNQLEWIKDRANVNNHQLIDSVRGLSAVLQSNSTGAETTYSAPSGNSVGWVWRASDSTAVSNSDGSITSTVSANTTSGFSIVSYTGSGSNATVGHGLSSVPKMVIIKNRDEGWAHWGVYHKDNGGINSGHLYSIALNLTGGASLSSIYWNNTAPTSSVFSIGTDTVINNSGSNIIAYCFAEVEGFSKFGSYTGNGSTDGPFVYTGFRPAFIIVKDYSAVHNWWTWDSARNTYNAMNEALVPNLNVAEQTPLPVDFTANGFKFRTSNGEMNQSGNNYIYMAFASNPFKHSLGR